MRQGSGGNKFLMPGCKWKLGLVGGFAVMSDKRMGMLGRVQVWGCCLEHLLLFLIWGKGFSFIVSCPEPFWIGWDINLNIDDNNNGGASDLVLIQLRTAQN